MPRTDTLPKSQPLRPRKESQKLPGTSMLILLLAGYVIFSYKKMLTTDYWHAFRTKLPLDLEIYLNGGKRVLDHVPLYDGDINTELGLPFTYPPFSGWVFSWLALGNFDVVGLLWYAMTAFAMFAIILMVFNTYKFELSIGSVCVAGLITLATMTLEPIHANLYFGQINIFLMLLVCLDFLLPEGKRLPGVGTGLAAGLKLTPAIFGVIFLFQRRWWAALGSFVTFLATVLVGNKTVVDGTSYWAGTFKDSTRIGDHTHPAAQSLKSVLIRVYDQDSSAIWGWIVGAIIVAMCAILWVFIQYNLVALSVAAVGIVACVVSPFTWTHHYVWVALLIVSVIASVLRWAVYVCGRVDTSRILGKCVAIAVNQVFAAVSACVGFAMVVPFVASAFFKSPTYSVLAHDEPVNGHWYMWMAVVYLGVLFGAAVVLGVRFLWLRKADTVSESSLELAQLNDELIFPQDFDSMETEKERKSTCPTTTPRKPLTTLSTSSSQTNQETPQNRHEWTTTPTSTPSKLLSAKTSTP